MNAEKIKVGGYQILTLLLLSVNCIIVAMSHALTIFYKHSPKFYCQEGVNPAARVDTKNHTYSSVCEVSCNGYYAFERASPDERSVVTEWQLVCERETLLRAASDVYYTGLMLGGWMAGIVADRIGRLPVLAICLYAQGTMAVALNVVQEYQLFLVFRGLQGFFIQGLESCTFVLGMELFPAKFRTLIAMVMLSMRSIGLVVLSSLSYAFPDWRILQLVVSVPTAVTVLFIWIIPESPRWLLAKGKRMEAEILLEKMVNYNALCGASRKDEYFVKANRWRKENDEDGGSTDLQIPEQPISKTQTSRTDHHPDYSKSAMMDDAKSLDESKNLLPPSNTKSRNNASTEECDIDKAETTSNMTTEFDMEETAMASSLPVTDEIGLTKVRGEGHTSSNHLFVAKETFAYIEAQKGKDALNTKQAFLRFLDSKFIGRSCIIIMCMWFSSSMAFHLLVTLPQGRLSTERHVSLALAAGMELISFGVVYLLILAMTSSHRRGPLCASQLLAGASCLTVAISSLACSSAYSADDWLVFVKTAVVIVGRMANIGSFFILRLVVIELFPTISRATVVGLCIVAEMLGGLLTPFILLLNSYSLEFPRILVGLICICTAFLALIFPETSGIILPDSVEESKNLEQKGRITKGNNENEATKQSKNAEVLRVKLFSEDWVDAGNGIIVNFTDKNSE